MQSTVSVNSVLVSRHVVKEYSIISWQNGVVESEAVCPMMGGRERKKGRVKERGGEEKRCRREREHKPGTIFTWYAPWDLCPPTRSHLPIMPSHYVSINVLIRWSEPYHSIISLCIISLPSGSQTFTAPLPPWWFLPHSLTVLLWLCYFSLHWFILELIILRALELLNFFSLCCFSYFIYVFTYSLTTMVEHLWVWWKWKGHEQDSEDCFIGVLMEGFVESSWKFPCSGEWCLWFVGSIWNPHSTESRTRNPSGHALTQTLHSNIWYYE